MKRACVCVSQVGHVIQHVCKQRRRNHEGLHDVTAHYLQFGLHSSQFSVTQTEINVARLQLPYHLPDRLVHVTHLIRFLRQPTVYLS